MVLCHQTEVIDEAPLELYAEKVRVEDTTLCYFINIEGLNLYKSSTYSILSTDKDKISSPDLSSNTTSSKFLSLSQIIKVKVIKILVPPLLTV